MTAGNLESSESRDVKLASERQLVWARFRRHKLALISTVIVALFYLVAFGAEFIAVNDPVETGAKRSLMPPQSIHFFDGWKPAPYVCVMIGKRDPVSLKKSFDADCTQKIPV
ncbi:MAG: ABC transporter permease, partial [Gammaproteobacteria bacterium]